MVAVFKTFKVALADMQQTRVSSLRLIRPNMNAGEAVSVAIDFELKAFQDSADKVSWQAPSYYVVELLSERIF